MVMAPGPGFRSRSDHLACFMVAPFSTPNPHFVNSQLVCLPPVGIFNKCYDQFVYLFH